jgi:cation:H+ antiporter
MKRLWWWKILLALLLTAPALVCRGLGLALPPLAAVLTYGGAVVASSFMLCWAAEAVQEDVSAGLATAILALIAILPEYAVDLYFAASAGHHPEQARFAAANMTGSNRLLLGLGWPLVLFLLVLWGRRSGNRVEAMTLQRSRRVELGFLALASLYALRLPLRAAIHWSDGVVLIGLYLLYVWRLSREERTETALVGLARRLGELAWWRRRLALTGMFLWAALVVVLVAKPFANGLVAGGRQLGLDEFLLVQWVAPLSTESPEFLVAALLALRGDADTSLGALLSSKVNQWTLLVGGLPFAYLLGGGHGSLPLDPRQVEEFWLTSAQTILGFAMVVKLDLRRWEAVALVALFAVQFPLAGAGARLWLSGCYFVLAAALLVRHRADLGRQCRLIWFTGKGLPKNRTRPSLFRPSPAPPAREGNGSKSGE